MGMVEVQMMVKLQKKLRTNDTTRVKELGKDWEKSIPNRKEIFEFYEANKDWLEAGYDCDSDDEFAEEEDDETDVDDDDEGSENDSGEE